MAASTPIDTRLRPIRKMRTMGDSSAPPAKRRTACRPRPDLEDDARGNRITAARSSGIQLPGREAQLLRKPSEKASTTPMAVTEPLRKGVDPLGRCTGGVGGGEGVSSGPWQLRCWKRLSVDLNAGFCRADEESGNIDKLRRYGPLCQPRTVSRRERKRECGAGRSSPLSKCRGCPRNCKRRARAMSHWETGKAARR